MECTEIWPDLVEPLNLYSLHYDLAQFQSLCDVLREKCMSHEFTKFVNFDGGKILRQKEHLHCDSFRDSNNSWWGVPISPGQRYRKCIICMRILEFVFSTHGRFGGGG